MVAELERTTAVLGEDGHLTIPHEISTAAGIRPGERLRLAVLGPGRIEVVAIEPETGVESAAPWQEGEIEPMTWEEAFTRFVITEPVDLEKIREEWESEAAQAVLAELERNGRRPG
jgi:bifunctional DNA-binding transcriptional regulator/antitoxin component of YhaV-PrlF toxin-antitoxin module